MSAAVTDWFDGSVKPVHIGPYERKIPGLGFTAFWWWSGEFWVFGGATEARICSPKKAPANNQSLPWRGLASDPKASKP